MLLEMHAHTSEHSSCSTIPAVELVRHIMERGLQGILITDHHYLWNEAELADLRLKASAPPHFIILSGQEVSTPNFGDILVYGASAVIPPGTPVESIRRDFPQAALVWAHPYRNGATPSSDMLTAPLIDGVEIFNSNHTVRENRHGLIDWHQHKFTALAGTDTHSAGYGGNYPTHFFHPVSTITAIAAEIRAGRCQPFFSEIFRDGANTKVTELAIGLRPETHRSEHFIIKATETEEKWQAAQRAYHIMNAFNDAGFSNDTYRIPATLDEDVPSHTVVEEFVDGTSLYELLLVVPEAEGRRLLSLTAQWLARLHRMAIRLNTPEQFLAKELQRLERYVEYFSAARHPHTRKARAVAEVLAEGSHDLVREGREFVQGHGDFHPKNIFVGSKDDGTPFVAAIDFDSSYTQPLSFDPGYFLAQFRSQFFERGDIRQRYGEEEFLAAYGAARGETPPFLRQDVSLFKARTNLNMASFFVWLGKGDDPAVWRLLVEAEQILATDWRGGSSPY